MSQETNGVGKRSVRHSMTAFGCAMIFGILAFIFSPFARPVLQKATYMVEGGIPQERSWPFFTPDFDAEYVTWDIPLHLSSLFPNKLLLFGNGMLHSAKINGHPLSVGAPQVLDGQEPFRMKLAPFLQPGENHLSLLIEKGKGHSVVRVFPDPADPLRLAFVVLLLGSIGLVLWGGHLGNSRLLPLEIAVVLFLGTAIRIIYVVGTPYSVRSYDTGAHVDYIKYVAQKNALPAPDLGFETHQAPLYYFACAMLMKGAGMEGTSSLYETWQLFSLLMAVGGFFICFLISRLLFPTGENRVPQCIFLAILAIYPGLVFVSSRLSNDAAYTFLSFLWVFLLLRSWRDPALKNWIWTFASLGVGMLTKNTTLALVAVTAACLAIHPGMSVRAKVAGFGTLFVTLLVMAGWYQIPRAWGSPDATSFVVANHDMGSGLRLPCSIRTMLTFNPVEVVKIPFNNPWIDATRRMFFSEYFFKSSLFGEWTMGDWLLFPARVLAVCGMALFPFVVLGFLFDLKERSGFFLPLFLTLAALSGSVLLYFWKCPYACNQDFRFQVLILLPLSFWLAKAVEKWKTLPAIVCGVFIANAALFLGLLIYL